MDKENGKGGENCSTSSKLPSQPDSGTLLDAASLFGAYWPRGADAAANSANLFASAAAASGAYGLGPHPSLPFGMLPPPASGRSMASYPPVPSSTAAAAAYSNAYTNTLSVAASQAASLGIPAASAAWWSMASHLAAQDYLARFQASGLNFASLGSPSDLQYSALGLHSLSGHHKKNSKNSKVSGKDGKPSAATVKLDKVGNGRAVGKYGGNNGGVKSEQGASPVGEKKAKDLGFSKEKGKNSVVSGGKSASIFTSPLSLASNSMDRSSPTGGIISSTPVSSGILSSALEGNSDPNSVLGGVRLPPDTEIIKYTSSIIGPKVPGTTNRGRKKTISLDPPLVSVHPSHSSTGMLIERSNKRPKLNDPQELNLSPGVSSDKVEVIKLPATNGSPSGLSVSAFGNSNSSDTTDTPLNLSLKPSTSTVNHTSSSLNSLSNMSANIGVDRISRRKPGPKPRRVVTSSTSTQLPPGAPSASLVQLFASADSPRPPSRAETPDSHSSGQGQSSSVSSMLNHKDGRPRNLGRGVSKPKKNTVASLLAQSRALGIKPMPMLDPNVPMNQQMSVLKSNILAAQQYIAETGGDEKTLNKFLQEKFRSTLSDSSTVDASTDSDNLTDSNQTDSEFEMENVMKKQKQYDENALRVPLEKGWKRETVIRGLTKSGGIKGDVTYIAPESTNKFKQMSDVTQYLDHQKSKDLTKDNFTFSCRVILGDYLQPIPTEMGGESTETVRLTEEDINRRLEELRATMRTSLPVEQRIEVARRQQAARIAARLDREQARLAKEIERSEKQEAARRDREARSQQMMEARRKRQEEMEKHKLEEQQRKQQEREMKRQQAAILKEQIYMQEISKHREMFYTVELERERRRQHMSLVKALENRRKLEERERKKQQVLAEKQANKEKKLEQRRMEMEILSELRKPCEDLELQQKPLPEYSRIPGLKLSGQAFADILMVFEFLHNFGETLGFDMESLPTLESLQQALLPSEIMSEAEEELFSVMTHLIVCAIEDPGIPNPARHTTILGQSLRQADITHMNLSEILRIYLYANATGEVKALTGVHFERDREKRVADHHQNDGEMQHTQSGKNAQYYELLHENPTWKMSDMLKDKPFMALSPTDKAAILAFICNELLQNKAVIRQIEGSLETVAHCKKEKWLLDAKIRKLRILHNRKVRSEAVEKAQAKLDGESLETPVDSPSLNKDDLLDDEENEMSENESVGTQPEEEEDNKLSGEELGKKLEKILKMSEAQLHTLNASTHQLRATCYGQDRYWRRYWSLPKAGGVFVEAMESAQPEVLESELEADKEVKTVEDVEKMVEDAVEDPTVDQEVRNIIGEEEKEVVEETKDIIENGIEDKEKNLEELRKSVDRMVEDLGKTAVKEEYSSPLEKEDSNSKEHFDENCKKFSLFEKLGQCMERENKTDETEETKDDIKNEILNELKSPENKTIKQEPEPPKEDQPEQKWFSVVPKDSMSCDNVCLTAGNRWDCGVGICTRDNITELKIPVFPPPNNSIQHSCDSPAPLQMTSEECAQLEYIKKHGMPKNLERRNVPHDKRYGWWRITDPDQLKAVLENLHVRGARERELKRTFLSSMQSMYEMKGKFYIEEGHKDVVELSGSGVEEVRFMDNGAPQPDVPGCWSRSIAHRVDLFLLEQVELLEDKVANASMQIKGWKIPNRDLPDDMEGQIVSLAKERLAALEAAIERRYLKPPLGVNQLMFNNANNNTSSASTTSATTTNSINTETPNNQNTSSQGDAPSANGAGACDKRASPVAPSPSSTTSASAAVAVPDDIPKGLATWREAVVRSQTSAQLAMCLYMLEASIAWDKSIMKANCQFCHSGDNEDKLLLCDGCDKGYHTYCFKPKMDNIPDGDWYCHECMNKATGERNCIVCGKKQSTTGTRLVTCDLCPRAYHTDCIRPPIGKVPRGKWYCTNCIAKKPQKKVKKNCTKPVSRDSESSDHPPPSPAPSHSSVTTSEDLNLTQQVSCNQSDVSNSSLTNACSPSAQKKERVPKKLLKELAPCKVILEDLECHDDAWPFLLPVNTKQFPTYKKIIKSPMDLSTIKKRLQDVYYKSRDEFCADVRQIFNNCETFNEDDSPVGKAGHCMRQFFESRWTELCSSHS